MAGLRLIVLAKRAGWHSRDLCRAGRQLGHQVEIRSWRQLVGHVGPGGDRVQAGSDPQAMAADQADAVLLRAMPAGSLEQVVFRMNALQRLACQGVAVINPPQAMETAVDKYLALTRLGQAGLPVPDTVVCQRLEDAERAFSQLGGDVVLKPLFGSEGFGITRVTDLALLQRAAGLLTQMRSVIYMQRYIDHGQRDYRLLVLGGQVVATMRREHPSDWRTNIARGAVGLAISPKPVLCDLAIRAAAACQTWLAGVDIIEDRTGQPYVLEVNSAPGWQALAEATHRDVAVLILEAVETYLRERRDD